MRIVNAMFGRERGGLEQAFLDYHAALSAAGHDVMMLVHPRAEIMEALERRGIGFYAFSNANAWDPVAVMRLRSWLRRSKPDVALAHGNRAVSLLKSAGARPLIGVAPNYKLKGAGLDAIICPTEDLARYCRTCGFAGGRLFIVPHAVVAPATPQQREWHNPPIIGAMGRLVQDKGFHVLIEALRRLRDAGLPFRAIIAGAGEEAKPLKRLAQERGLGEVIEFPGWQDDPRGFFNAIDVFCLPSLHEPFGIVLLEAMAQTLPVIAADSEGPSEILRGAEGGIIVPKDNPVALTAAITRLLGNPDAARALGLKGYAIIRERYSMSRLTLQLNQVICAVAQ